MLPGIRPPHRVSSPSRLRTYRQSWPRLPRVLRTCCGVRGRFRTLRCAKREGGTARCGCPGVPPGGRWVGRPSDASRQTVMSRSIWRAVVRWTAPAARSVSRAVDRDDRRHCARVRWWRRRRRQTDPRRDADRAVLELSASEAEAVGRAWQTSSESVGFSGRIAGSRSRGAPVEWMDAARSVTRRAGGPLRSATRMTTQFSPWAAETKAVARVRWRVDADLGWTSPANCGSNRTRGRRHSRPAGFGRRRCVRPVRAPRALATIR